MTERVASLLEVDDLRVAYGHVDAVRGVTLRVPEGKIVTLIGPTGAGKTSILSALAGLVLLVIILFLPNGIVSLPGRIAAWRRGPKVLAS